MTTELALRLTDFVLAGAAGRGDRPALVDAVTGRALGYAALAAEVTTLANGLAAQGVQPGDVIAVCAPGGLEFAVTWYAALSAGATVAPLDPRWPVAEIAAQLRRTGARWLASISGPARQKARAAAPGARTSAAFLTRHGAITLTATAPPPGRVPLPAGLALLARSRGTTGRPRTVALSHRQLMANLRQVRHAHRIAATDVLLTALPLHQTLGLQLSLNLALRQGATVVLAPRFTLRGFLRASQAYGVTRADLPAPLLLALAARAEVADYDLSRLRLLTSAGAPLRAHLAWACAARAGCRVKQAFGLTEAGLTHVVPDHAPDRPGSVGPPLPGVRCRLVRPGTTTEVAAGQPGELLIRSASPRHAYLDDPAAGLESGGWLRTGDLALADADGWYHVTGRISARHGGLHLIKDLPT
jgi:acyl-CoA synthetase (AMP-forming)/AMP-acid ligase II